MKRILVPIDFSEESMNALHSAHSLAKETGSEVLLVHVIEDPTAQSFNTMGIVDYSPMDNVYVVKLMEKTKERMDKLVNESEYSDILLKYRIEIGHAYEQISKVIAEHKSSLIVMGSKGASGIVNLLVGSVADKVVRTAACPVITVKSKCDLSNIKSIVFATDLRIEQESIVGELKNMQAHYDAHLHLVKAYDSEWILEKDVKRRIDEFAEQFGFDNFSTTAVKDSDEVDAILDFADEIDADMIALATHHRRGLESLFTGFISKNVVNKSDKPIWTMAIPED
ncbi:MAG: universal stress protein [Cyclobacteriaceae bacterium]